MRALSVAILARGRERSTGVLLHCSQPRLEAWDGEVPITKTWSARDPPPPHLVENLGIPVSGPVSRLRCRHMVGWIQSLLTTGVFRSYSAKASITRSFAVMLTSP